MSKEESIKSLKEDIRKLKRQLYNLNKLYNGEVKTNRNLINANTRLHNENKWLKRDLERIPEVLKYIDFCKKEIGFVCNVKKLREMLTGANKDENLDNYIDV
ncbi:MAG: hypothetical protein IKL65_00520 [Bacilli bacterium]|nr:hypothetical protein [Bacilli bacterium]MBR6689800.1 hypothetical protein [Bacilli bacterium]